MSGVEFNFRSKVWLWKSESAPGSWHFVTLPKKDSAVISDLFHVNKRGFGSIKVKVDVGSTSWSTSIFPGENKCYILPLKAQVRKAENIKVGTILKYTISIEAQ